MKRRHNATSGCASALGAQKLLPLKLSRSGAAQARRLHKRAAVSRRRRGRWRTSGLLWAGSKSMIFSKRAIGHGRRLFVACAAILLARAATPALAEDAPSISPAAKAVRSEERRVGKECR